MTASELDALVVAAQARYRDAAALVEASLKRYRPFDSARTYTPDESADEDQWFRMLDVRNRIAHDYLPDQLRGIYTALLDTYGPELLRLRDTVSS